MAVRTETFSAADGEFISDAPPLPGPRGQSRAYTATSQFDPMGGADVFMTQNPMYNYSSTGSTAGQIEYGSYNAQCVDNIVFSID